MSVNVASYDMTAFDLLTDADDAACDVFALQGILAVVVVPQSSLAKVEDHDQQLSVSTWSAVCQRHAPTSKSVYDWE